MTRKTYFKTVTNHKRIGLLRIIHLFVNKQHPFEKIRVICGKILFV